MKNLLFPILLFISTTVFAQSGNNWMSNLPYGTRLSDLSIPGTHDSGASSQYIRFYNPAQPFANAQNKTIEQQLDYGVRFLDIRVAETTTYTYVGWPIPIRIPVRAYSIAHGVIGYNLSLQGVVNKIKGFLTANPGEVVIMSLKVENSSNSSEDQRIKNHCRNVLVNNRYYTGSTGSKRLMNDLNGTTPVIHMLGWARGQIIIMDRNGFGPTGNRIGIGVNWSHNTTNGTTGTDDYVRVQDRYDGGSYADKLGHIANMRNIARNNHGNTSGSNKERLTVNFASFTKSGPLGVPVALSTVASNINPSVESHYNSTSNRERCILVVDYVDRSLAESIWRNNFNGSTYIKSGNAANHSKDKATPLASMEEQEALLAPALETIIAPNPASGPFALMINNVQTAGKAQIMIHDMQGRTVLYKEVYLDAGMNHLRIEESVFASGLYVVNITTEHGKQQTLKLSYQ